MMHGCTWRIRVPKLGTLSFLALAYHMQPFLVLRWFKMFVASYCNLVGAACFSFTTGLSHLLSTFQHASRQFRHRIQMAPSLALQQRRKNYGTCPEHVGWHVRRKCMPWGFLFWRVWLILTAVKWSRPPKTSRMRTFRLGIRNAFRIRPQSSWLPYCQSAGLVLRVSVVLRCLLVMENYSPATTTLSKKREYYCTHILYCNTECNLRK